MLGAIGLLWRDRAVIPGQVVILWRVPFPLVLSFGDLFSQQVSLTQVRGLWRRKPQIRLSMKKPRLSGLYCS